MNLTALIQPWLLLTVCIYICSSTPVIQFYDDNSDLSDQNNPQNWPVDSYERLEVSEVKRDAPLRHVASALRHKHRRKEMSKRRLSAGEILQLLRQVTESRGAYSRGRWKSMRFGVSRKRSIQTDDWDQLPLAKLAQPAFNSY